MLLKKKNTITKLIVINICFYLNNMVIVYYFYDKI